MKFKIKRVATPRQLLKAKWTISMVVLMLGVQLVAQFFTNAHDEATEAEPHNYYADYEYHSMEEYEAPRGRIVYYGKKAGVCDR